MSRSRAAVFVVPARSQPSAALKTDNRVRYAAARLQFQGVRAGGGVQQRLLVQAVGCAIVEQHLDRGGAPG